MHTIFGYDFEKKNHTILQKAYDSQTKKRKLKNHIKLCYNNAKISRLHTLYN